MKYGVSGSEEKNKNRFTYYFKNLGLAGFLFFLVKGLVWLVVIWGFGKAC